MNYTDKTHEAVHLLKQMVAIPSFSREEEKVADLIFQFMKSISHISLQKQKLKLCLIFALSFLE